jgi:hypothetical protein
MTAVRDIARDGVVVQRQAAPVQVNAATLAVTTGLAAESSGGRTPPSCSNKLIVDHIDVRERDLAADDGEAAPLSGQPARDG